MPRDYLSSLSFNDMSVFIKRMMGKKFDTNLVIRIKNISTSSTMNEIDFEVMVSNGVYARGLAYFTQFGCTMEISHGKNKDVKNYDKEWAYFVYQVLKKKDEFGFDDYKLSSCYKAEYNENLVKIRDKKRAEAELECEQNMLK